MPTIGSSPPRSALPCLALSKQFAPSAALARPTPDGVSIHRPSIEQRVTQAIARAQDNLLSSQTSNGSWKGTNTAGPLDTARVLIVERYLGALKPEDARDGGRWLLSQQRPDGSFASYPDAQEGSADTTAAVYAALVCAGVPRHDPNMERANRWLAQSGASVGLDTQTLQALAGLRKPFSLPIVDLAYKLVPGFDRHLASRFASAVVLGANILPPLICALQRGGDPNPIFHPLLAAEYGAVDDYLTEHQGKAGDWYGVTFMTAMGAACLHALGNSVHDPRICKALNFLDGQKMRGADGMQVTPFTSEIWDTALSVRALVASGVPAGDPRIQKAAQYLVDKQCTIPTPEDWQNPVPSMARVGGWAFEDANQLAPDCDCAGVALSALSDALPGNNGAGLHEALHSGQRWQNGMQNADGGWPAWTHGHATKSPGPLPANGMGASFGMPMVVSDPSTEGLTGRVLFSMGKNGYTVGHAGVRKAVEFLKNQQESSGGWWERWGVNYIMGTSFVLSGLHAVGEDMNAPYVQRAADFLSARQNPDGGWGETADSYRDPAKAGVGPSTATLTSLAVMALIDAGRGRSNEVQHGVEWLVNHQDSQGAWSDVNALGVLETWRGWYYRNDMFPKYWGLEALARYQVAAGQ